MLFYDDSREKTLAETGSSEKGLTENEAEKRLAENGENELAGAKKKPLIVKFFEQFKDVMILVLIAAAAVSAVIALVRHEYNELIDSGIILVIVILNAIIGLVQENKAEAALESLKKMNKPFSKVYRDGELKTVKSGTLVVGDVVQLDAGDIVPADLRLLSSASLKIGEAALTGESVPSEKNAAKTVSADAPLGDRSNMAYSGGTVAYGRGKGVVVATGMNTEVGKIAKMLSTDGDQSTPLQKQLAKTAKIISIAVLAIAAVIFAALILRHTSDIGSVIIDAFMTSVAIAVAAIPEGLPAVVTIVLAVGVQRMSKRNAIIRNLPAVETLGCCEIICSDKTGTLTLNCMTVKEVYTVSGGTLKADKYVSTPDTDVLSRSMTLCNDTAESENGYVGDPTETALVAFTESCGISYADLKNDWERIDEIPFDSVRKLMTTVNKHGGETAAHIKGATDIMLPKCSFVLENGAPRPITEADKNNIKEANREMAAQALRVLGVAVKYDLSGGKNEYENDMVFVGLVGMIDPPRPEVKEAVKICLKAGMRPVMITGDHVATASAIAKEIGILRDGDTVMTGAEVDALSDDEFKKIIKTVSVFARVSPENKVRIVNIYRSFGSVVGMTGDGVNDAPSIKKADIGIGMGITGTEVSKGAADMILADDNFATIIGAVEEGRKIYSNITKAVQFLLSANIAEVLCLFIATVFLNVDFLTPIMILWVNLVTDSLPALALGVEAAESDVMNYPPRKAKASLFQGKTGRDIIVQGIIQTGLVMLSFCLGNYVLSDGVSDHRVAMTMAFVSLCIIQLFHSFNLKSQNHSIFNKKLFKNKLLDLSFGIGALLVLSVVLIPFMRGVFGTAALNAGEWGIALGCGAAVIPLVEVEKVIENAFEK
jgi:Ca2+-transporting ATPase